jgi:lipopolysaccharide/colanic/teichoic acid biosynthesis glycosyltransferase/glycosyltransferase involved in cell wall biosynthesis
MKSVLIGVTADVSLAFYKGHKRALMAADLEAVFLSAPGAFSRQFALSETATVHEVPMSREPSLLADLLSLLRLIGVIRRVRPVLTNFGTPKAGLLGNLAAFICRVPRRVYTLHGLRLETVQGWRRPFFTLLEKIACGCAHKVICVSPSLRERAIELGLVSPEKAVVPLKGTLNGIEVESFAPSPANIARAERLGPMLGLARKAPVIGYVGRFTRDKGIRELFEAYIELRRQHPQLRLLLVGDYEQADPVPLNVRAAIDDDPGILCTGFVEDASPYYHLMDVVVLPTYREGFSQVSIEAQASGVPIIVTRATGIVDSLLDGRTGLVVPIGDVSALVNATGSLLDDPLKRAAMGIAGQKWVSREFDGEKVRAAIVTEYQQMLKGASAQGGFRAAQSGWRYAVKRALDLIIVGMFLPLILPLLIIIAVLIRISIGGPVLFRQLRPGRYGLPFTLMKFRTMNDDRDAAGQLLPDAQRLTRFGRFLRSTSLDELPELWNVVTGDMALVGPRPLLMQYLERYSNEQARRHDVLPGITGWAQINGRNAISWEKKFALDTCYVDHWSLALDLRILLATLMYALRREGISQAGHATMPEFFSDISAFDRNSKAGATQ